ncbi:hypothetical protein MCOR06_005457 [Pyricularia oryzae]|nr:hypothetical protein MCOR06_005457 [Pyricularia oryzae]
MASTTFDTMLSQMAQLTEQLEAMKRGDLEASDRAFVALTTRARGLQKTMEDVARMEGESKDRQSELNKRLSSTRTLEKEARRSLEENSLKLLDAVEKQVMALELVGKLQEKEKATVGLEVILNHRETSVSAREEGIKAKDSELALRECQAVEEASVLEKERDRLEASSAELDKERQALKSRSDELDRVERMLMESRADLRLREATLKSRDLLVASKEHSLVQREMAVLVAEERCQAQADRKAALDRRMDEVCRRECEMQANEAAFKERQATLDRLEQALLEGTSGEGNSLEAKLETVATKLGSVEAKTTAEIHILGEQVASQFANQGQKIGQVGIRMHMRNDQVSEEIALALGTVRSQVGRQITGLIKEFVDCLERTGRQFGTQLAALEGKMTTQVTELDGGLAAKIDAMGGELSGLGACVQKEHNLQQDSLAQLLEESKQRLADVAEVVNTINSVREGVATDIAQQREEAAGQIADLADKVNSVKDGIEAGMADQQKEAAGQIDKLVQKMDSVQSDLATDIVEAGGCILKHIEDKTGEVIGQVQSCRASQKTRLQVLKADLADMEGTLLQRLVAHSHDILRGALHTRGGDSILSQVRDDLQSYIGGMLQDVITIDSESPAKVEGMLSQAAEVQRRVNGSLKDVAAHMEDVSRKCTDLWMANRLPKRVAEGSADEPAAKRVRGYLDAKEAGELTFERFTSGISLVMGCVKLDTEGGASPSAIFSQLMTIIRDHANTDNLLEFLAEKVLHSKQPRGLCLAGLAYLGMADDAVGAGECQCEAVLASEELLDVCLVIQKLDDEPYGKVSLYWGTR